MRFDYASDQTDLRHRVGLTVNSILVRSPGDFSASKAIFLQRLCMPTFW